MDTTQLSCMYSLQEEIYKNSISKGFHDKGSETNFATKIALIHSELSEAIEADREGDPPSNHIPDYTKREEELADVIIRVLDCAKAHGLFVVAAMSAKIEFNKSRSHKHGGKKY